MTIQANTDNLFNNDRPIILIDFMGICYPIVYSKNLTSVDDVPITLRQVFLEKLLFFSEKFESNNFVFCCDSLHSFRKKTYPTYKEKRHETKTEKEEAILRKFYAEIDIFKTELKNLGFNNILVEHGLEADDIMAVITKSNCLIDYIMVTDDGDMYQCLASNVKMYSPKQKKMITHTMWSEEYNFKPCHWWKVKALAGCTSDKVKGVKGLTDKNNAKTCIKFFNKELNKDSVIYKRIHTDESKSIYARNKRLVKLPYKDTPQQEIVENTFKKGTFKTFCDKYYLDYYLDKECEYLERWKRFFTLHNKHYTKRRKLKRTRKKIC